MKNLSDESDVLTPIKDALEKTKQDNNHLTLTLNDVYDTFLKLNLKIDRNKEHSEIIIKALKDLRAEKIQIESLIISIIKEIILKTL